MLFTEIALCYLILIFIIPLNSHSIVKFRYISDVKKSFMTVPINCYIFHRTSFDQKCRATSIYLACDNAQVLFCKVELLQARGKIPQGKWT